MPIGRFAGQGFNLFNPFTYHNLGKAIDKTFLRLDQVIQMSSTLKVQQETTVKP